MKLDRYLKEDSTNLKETPEKGGRLVRQLILKVKPP